MLTLENRQSLVLLSPVKRNTWKVFSNTLNHVKELKQYCFPHVPFGRRSENTVRGNSPLAGRVKIATPQTSNYFRTKNTLLMAIFTLENSSLLKLERKSLGYQNFYKYSTLKDVAPFLQVPDLFFLSIWLFQTGRIPGRTEKIFFFPLLQKVTVLHSLAELAVSASIGELLQIKFRDNINTLYLIMEKLSLKSGTKNPTDEDYFQAAFYLF